MYDRNKATVLGALDAIMCEDWGRFGELCDEEFVDHDPLPFQDVRPGREGIRQTFEFVRRSFPDLRFAVNQIIAEGDKVVVHLVTYGTHSGKFMGFPPTGKTVAQTSLDVFRVESGRITEHWGVRDDLSLMQQVGVIPVLQATQPAVLKL